ncbi:MAG TPA: hypothetical protein VML91_14920 [Burkholderiales bacterium]|nr:hypothetical protein [Burkholderiales bacterium]
MRRLAVLCSILAACGCAQTPPPLRIAATWPLPEHELPYPGTRPATHRLQLDLYTFTDTSWQPERIVNAVREAAAMFAQCGIRLERAELYSLEGGDSRFRYLSTPAARELVRRMRPAKPAVFFVRDTRQQPVYDAEAFGRRNTASRPELAGTVWITAYIRDLPIALAHELAHVLMDSGEHSQEPGNLMREDTSLAGAAITRAQCERMTQQGTEHGWLQTVRPPP